MPHRTERTRTCHPGASLMMGCAVAACLVSATGCAFDPRPESGALRCASDAMACPPGYQCRANADGEPRCYESDGEQPDPVASDGRCDLAAELPEQVVPSPRTGTMTLDRRHVWVLEQLTYVDEGQTLTIEPCTRVVGSGDKAVLVVARGGKIQAKGETDAPIVFTSRKREERRPGLWGGLVILGRAPNFAIDPDALDEKDPDKAGLAVEGLPLSDVRNYHGGNDPEDSSGVLSYVRVEYSGIDLGNGDEINGLTLGSVGSGTQIDHVMVNSTVDDCFEWFGGTVSASYLICNNAGDDMFDADTGFQGTLSWLLGRHVAPTSDNPNGFEFDSDNEADAEPQTTVVVRHATLCGADSSAPSYGMVLRENLRGRFDDVVIAGFDYSVDARDEFGSPEDARVELTHARFFDWHDAAFEDEPELAEDEVDPDDDLNDDDGFDEAMWFSLGTGNQLSDPPVFGGASCLNGSGPTGAVNASHIGAFSPGADWNLNSLWVNWRTE